MRPDLHERRERTWELLVLDGRPRREVVEQISDAYGVTEDTVREDITTMVDWLPKLDYAHDKWTSRESRLRELRVVRQRLHEMAEAAAEQDDLRMELDIRRELIRTLKLDEDLFSDVDRDGSERQLSEMLRNDPLA